MEPETLLMVEDLTELEPAVASAPAPAAAASPVPEFSALPGVLWEADASTLTVTMVTGAAEPILGYPPAHWLETPRFISERIHPDDRENVMVLYHVLAAMGGEASAEFRALSASGEPVWCRETVRVAAIQGRGLIASGVMTAIGQRHLIEKQSEIAGRTEALRTLAARLAHDLNNPLMIVTGYGEEILQSLPAGDPVRVDVAEILAATMRMSDLTAHLLAFSRPINKPGSKIRLGALMEGLHQRVQEITTAPIKLDTAASASELWIFADQEQLSDAVAALASAAAENTHHVTALQVTSEASLIAEQVQPATLSPGNYARIEVRAAGEGSGAASASIFESFLPGKDPAHLASPGAARAYATIRLWGGDVSFSSDAQQGSAFSIYLPCVEPEPAADEIVPAEVLAEPEPEPVEIPEPVHPTILVVEDEPGIRGLVRKILRRENYVVIEAGSAEEALTLESSFGGRIDLLLTDVMLPGMNGRDLAGQLRDKNPELKIVYISGYTDDASVRAGEFPPGAKFLQKPFTLGALTGTVRESLNS
jgi:CheY-like chemotaxis protein/signal transduction histidine kinase